MNRKELVSIIVPVYGVAAYLPQCVESLLAQTYPHLQILLVDDGAKDGSGDICDRYARQDSRVTVIHKKNGGAASARNAGLDAAAGEYICFVDGDDLVEPRYVESLLTQLQQAQADIAVCGFYQVKQTGVEPFEGTEPPGEYNRAQYLSLFLRSWTCSLLWNKLFRRSAIGSLRMEEGHRIDDEFFTYRTVLQAGKITVFSQPLYLYRLRASGVMRDTAKYQSRILLDRISYTLQRYDRVCQILPELEQPFFLDMLDSFCRYWSGCRGLPEVETALRSWSRANVGAILHVKLPVKQKLSYLHRLLFRGPGGVQLFPEDGETDLFA